MKSWLATYMEYTDHLEAPREFQMWAGVSAMAAVLQRKVWVEMGDFRWFPNFYILLIADPGVLQKTTTIDRAYNLIRDAPFYGQDVLENPGVYLGPSSVTWQALISIIAKSLIEVPNPRELKETVTSASLSLCLGELGTFLDTQDSKMVDALVDLWDCRREFEKVTKGNGEELLPYPYLNMIGGTTPGWVRNNFPRYMIQGGFTSRTIFALAHTKRQLCAYPHRAAPHKEHELLRLRLIDGLCRMFEMTGPVPLTEDAYAYGEQWYEEHHKNPAAHLTTELMLPYHSRKQCHLHKIAMILAISECCFTTAKPVIDKVHLVKAEEILSQSEDKFLAAVSMMGEVVAMQAVGDVKLFVRKEKRVRHSDLLRHFAATFPLKELHDAIKFNNQAREFLSIWDQQLGEQVHCYPYPGRSG